MAHFDTGNMLEKIERKLENLDDDIGELKKCSLTNTMNLDNLMAHCVTRSMLHEVENKLLRAIVLAVGSMIITEVVARL